MRCYWEHVGKHIENLGTYRKLDGNIVETYWVQREKMKNPFPSPCPFLNSKERTRAP
jgi:hypothetical protein